MITITGLFTHPIKSCAAQAHPQGVEISVAGLDFDREWVVVDQQGVFMTQRRWPRMALIQPAGAGRADYRAGSRYGVLVLVFRSVGG